MLNQKVFCGELREFNVVGFVDDLGSKLLLPPRDGCPHEQIRYLDQQLEKSKKLETANWKTQPTCETKTALLNRSILAKLCFSEFDEGPSGFVEQEALGTLVLHASTKGPET
jgi:hypothetical protein